VKYIYIWMEDVEVMWVKHWVWEFRKNSHGFFRSVGWLGK